MKYSWCNIHRTWEPGTEYCVSPEARDTKNVYIHNALDYFDEHLGKQITSRSQRKTLMKERGLREGRGDDDRRIVLQKREQADKIGISVSELDRRYARQRLKF